MSVSGARAPDPARGLGGDGRAVLSDHGLVALRLGVADPDPARRPRAAPARGAGRWLARRHRILPPPAALARLHLPLLQRHPMATDLAAHSRALGLLRTIRGPDGMGGGASQRPRRAGVGVGGGARALGGGGMAARPPHGRISMGTARVLATRGAVSDTD